SAVAQPQASFGGKYVHQDLFQMAAAYAFHLAQNQPFIDGNKRTGLYAALVFLRLNGFSVKPASDRLYQAMLDIAEHKLDKAGLAKLFRELSSSIHQ
ncbi:MAG: type II toxin-antitoxin system death-on-curing family toxin, partial [Myxococcota bacterium]